MASGVNFKLTLVDGLSGPALAGSRALASVEKGLKAVNASAKAIVPMKPIAVGSKASDKAIASDQAKSAAAANKARIADERATAKAIVAVEKQLQAEKRVMAKAAAAEAKALDKRNAAQARATVKAETAAAKEVSKAQKAAKAEAAKAAKKLAADQAAAGEAFAAESEAIAASAAAATAAVLALAAAFGAVVLAGAQLALEASEAKNDTLDMLEAFMGSQEAALSTYDAIQDITRDVAISQGRAQELAQSLTAAGISNKAMLLDAIKSIGQVDSVIKGAGDKVQAIIERANTAGKFQLNAKQLVGTGVQMQDLFESIAAATGKGVKQVETELKAGKISAEVGVAALTKTIDSKFGDLAGKQLLDLGSQTQRFKDNIGRLFEDVDTGPFLEALKTVLDLFDSNTAAGSVLKDTLTGAFTGLFNAVANVAPFVTTFLKGLIIIGLKVAIALKPLLAQMGLIGNTAKKGKADTSGLANAMDKVGTAAAWVAEQLAKLLSHKTVLYMLAGAAVLVAAPFIAMYAAVALATAALGALVGIAAGVIDWLLNLGQKAWTAGSALVTGLVNGVIEGGSKLIQAVKNLAGNALKAFKNIFKIASPSRVMMGVGENISLGLAQGIADGGKAVNDNMTAVVDPIAPPQAKGLTQSATSSVSLSGVTIQITITGVQNAEELEARMPSIMNDALEAAVQTKGLSPATVAA